MSASVQPFSLQVVCICGACSWWEETTSSNFGQCIAYGGKQHRTAVACPEWHRRPKWSPVSDPKRNH